MSLLDQFMPRPSVRQVDRVAVAAVPERAFAAARTIDALRVPFIRVLFDVRLLPGHVASLLLGRQSHVAQSSRIDDFTRPGSGFLILGEQPGHELVVGSIGKFWQSRIEYAEVDPEGFARFSKPGFGRLAWSLRVDPRHGGGSWITFDLRAGTTDQASLARFRRFWLGLGQFSHAIRRRVLHTLQEELGAAPADDDSRLLPGDELLPLARFKRTHVKTIEAPPERVWPWLLQMGGQRGGWYRLRDSAVPAGIVVPELQRLAVGDIVPAPPRGKESFSVLRVQPGRHLVVGTPSLSPGGGPSDLARAPLRSTWTFLLDPIGDIATRVLVRVRADYEPTVRSTVTRAVMASGDELLERRQLSQLKRQVETRA